MFPSFCGVYTCRKRETGWLTSLQIEMRTKYNHLNLTNVNKVIFEIREDIHFLKALKIYEAQNLGTRDFMKSDQLD